MAIRKADPVQLHVKSGDTVKVIAGDEKGKTGVIKSVNRVTQRVTVEGLNLVTKHNKPSAKSPGRHHQNRKPHARLEREEG